jgi:hypothetical protein
MKGLTALAARWRMEAEHLRSRYGAASLAQLCETHAEELEAVLTNEMEEELDPHAAALFSGYSKSQLRRLQVDGLLENVGRQGRPRYRKRDLPRKAGRSSILAGSPSGGWEEASATSTRSSELEARLDTHFNKHRTKG